ncbi:Hsp70 family protein [Virgisporangium ochraceum]|uniref:Hsp70 family protein n=1 Tax=Virgisporangium ochraceum TaxID=65505 RepID=A0A8J4A2A0_9ACTN|nr:Hsp70 family protein [Virgisporangium ochraceum]GIJ72540.1 hypothetical protein Voc01_074570 [Virgisporangium ochraceum]
MVSRLGVDFGTSNTVAAVAGSDGQVRPLLFDGSPLLPSAVFVGTGDGVLVGVDALRAAVGGPAGLEPYPKRHLDEGTVWLGERELPVVDLVAAVLARVRAEAVRVVGPGTALEAVLTYPATWGPARRDLLAGAAARAGLGRVGLVPEPVAAAAYFTTLPERPVRGDRRVVVYDLGAGTLDVSVVRPGPGGFDVAAADGLADVGGLDLDAVIVRHARTVTADADRAWQRLDRPRTPADRHARYTLWQAARAVKEQLSRYPVGDLYVPLVDRQIHVTRDEFTAAAHPHLRRTATFTREVLERAGVPLETVGGVFLVGGSSRVPLVATLLHRTLGIAPVVLDHPELVVAEGALRTPVPAGPVPSAGSPALRAASPTPALRAESPAPALRAASPTPRPGPDTPPRDKPARSHAGRRTRRAVIAAAFVVAAAAVPGSPPRQRGAIRYLPSTGGQPTASPGQPALAAELVAGPSFPKRPMGLAFSPDGATLALASEDRSVLLWDVAGQRTVAALPGHTEMVRDVEFSPDGTLLASTGNDGTLRLWDVASRRQLAALTGAGPTSTTVTFSPDGAILATDSNQVVQLWDVARRQPRGTLTGHTYAVNGIAFSPDGAIVASGSVDRTVLLWDVASGRAVATLLGHPAVTDDVAFSPDGAVLATGGNDNAVRLWDTASRQPLAALVGHDDGVRSVAFNPDGSVLAAATGRGTVLLWDVARRTPVTTLTGHGTTVREVAFSPDGALVATVSDDSTMRLWRLTGR